MSHPITSKSWNVSSWKGPVRLTESSQDCLKLNHITKSFIQTLLELGRMNFDRADMGHYSTDIILSPEILTSKPLCREHGNAPA